jgi:hypothetical protein
MNCGCGEARLGVTERTAHHEPITPIARLAAFSAFLSITNIEILNTAAVQSSRDKDEDPLFGCTASAGSRFNLCRAMPGTRRPNRHAGERPRAV